MNKLQLQKTAFDVAFATAEQNMAQAEAALSAKAVDLQLNDQDYQKFRNSVLLFRTPLVQANNADIQAAKAPAAAPKPQPPAPAPKPVS